MHNMRDNVPTRIALYYFFISFIWILLSAFSLKCFFKGIPENTILYIEIAKGVAFIAATYFLLYKLIINYTNRLKKSEEKYNDMFEYNPNPMWIYDLKSYMFLDVNIAAIRKYGYNRDEFLNMTIYDIRPEEEANRLREYTANKIHIGNTLPQLWKHKLKNGNIIIANIISHDIVFNKKPAKLVLSLDVTEKEPYERELEKQQQVLKQINTDLNKNLVQLKINENKLKYTQKAAKIAGWSYNLERNTFNFDYEFYELSKIDDLRGSSLDLNEFLKFIHPEDESSFLNFLNKVNTERITQECILRIKSAAEWNFIKFEASLHLDLSECSKSIKGFIQDIDELTKINIENKRLAEIINKIKNLIVITNKDSVIEWANAAFYETTEYSRKETIGKVPWDLIKVPDSSLEMVKVIKDAVNNRQEFCIEIENISKNGRCHWLQIDGSPIYDENGCYAGYISIEHEITERRLKEAKIREQNKLLDKTAWISSHQMRKPLASILGIIELMKYAKSESEIKEYIQLLEVCGNELDQYIKDSVTLIESNV